MFIQIWCYYASQTFIIFLLYASLSNWSYFIFQYF